MLLMAKRKGRARERGQTKAVQVEFNLPLLDALEAQAKAERRTRRAVIVLAVEEYLAKRGRWQAPDVAGDE